LKPEAALNAKQKAIIETAKRFAREVMRPAGIERDKIDSNEKEVCR